MVSVFGLSNFLKDGKSLLMIFVAVIPGPFGSSFKESVKILPMASLLSSSRLSNCEIFGGVRFPRKIQFRESTFCITEGLGKQCIPALSSPRCSQMLPRCLVVLQILFIWVLGSTKRSG